MNGQIKPNVMPPVSARVWETMSAEMFRDLANSGMRLMMSGEASFRAFTKRCAELGITPPVRRPIKDRYFLFLLRHPHGNTVFETITGSGGVELVTAYVCDHCGERATAEPAHFGQNG